MAAAKDRKPIPIYTSGGDWAALLVFPYIFSTIREWIGYVTKTREVYDTDGVYVGWLTNEPRILRKRITSTAIGADLSPTAISTPQSLAFPPAPLKQPTPPNYWAS